MKKYYCDHCGNDLGSEPANRLAFLKPGQSVITCDDTFHFCDKCREEFFGWLNNKPAEAPAMQPKEAKKAEFPVWATIKSLAARFCRKERRMNAMMTAMMTQGTFGVKRRKAKDGRNWWYEYLISKKAYMYLCSKLDCK